MAHRASPLVICAVLAPAARPRIGGLHSDVMAVRSAGQLIDAVQTTGIIVIAAALIYVVIRLERQIRCWAETLASVNQHLGDQATAIIEQAAVADTLMSQRIEAHETRIEAIEKRLPPIEPSS